MRQPVIVERVPYSIVVDQADGRATEVVASCVCFAPQHGVPGTKDRVPVKIFAPVLIIREVGTEVDGDLIGFI